MGCNERNTFEAFPKTTCNSSRIVAHCHTMSYVDLQKNASLMSASHGMQEVAGSIPVGSIVVSYAEFGDYEYSSCGDAVVTLIKKAVNYSFEFHQ